MNKVKPWPELKHWDFWKRSSEIWSTHILTLQNKQQKKVFETKYLWGVTNDGQVGLKFWRSRNWNVASNLACIYLLIIIFLNKRTSLLLFKNKKIKNLPFKPHFRETVTP